MERYHFRVLRQLRPLFFQLVQSAVRVHLCDILHLQTGREFGDYRHDGRRDELQAPDAPLYDFGCHHCSDDFPVGAYVIPKGSVTRLNFENIYKKKKKTEFAQNVQLQVDTGVIAFIEHFDGRTKTGYHFSLDKFVNKKLVSHLTAASVSYDTLSDERYHWRINNYTLRELKGMREYISHGSRIDSIIAMEPSDFLLTRNQQETLTSPELKEYIVKQRARGSGNVKPFEVEYQKRFATPFASFILTIIGLSLSARKRKGGMGLYLGIGLALSASYILFQTVSSTFAINADWPPALAAWLPNIIFAFIAFFLYKKAPQ